jgi:hypothetical protein
MQRFLSLSAECVKIQETADASQVFSLYLFSFCLFSFHLLVLMLLITTDIFSFVTVALATAHARITASETKLKTSTEPLNDANAAKGFC